MYEEYCINLEKVRVELGEDEAYNMYGDVKVLLNGELVAEADFILDEDTGETCKFKNRKYFKKLPTTKQSVLEEKINELFDYIEENIFIEFTGEELDSMLSSVENGNFEYEIIINEDGEIYLG